MVKIGSSSCPPSFHLSSFSFSLPSLSFPAMSVKVAGFKVSDLFQQMKEGIESLPAEERAANAKKVSFPFRSFFFSIPLLPSSTFLLIIMLCLSPRSVESSSSTSRPMTAKCSLGT